jgi:hypothetical protein
MNFMAPAAGAIAGAPVGALAEIGMGGGDGTGTAGGMAGMLGGAALGGAMGSRKLIMAIAQALKRQAPQAPDEQVMQQAQKLLQNPTPEVEQFIQRVMGQGGGQPPTGGMGAM